MVGLIDGVSPAPVLNNLPIGQEGILPVHLVPQKLLQIQLNKLDMTAARRVENDEPAPGPFGSAIMLYNTATGEHFLVGDRHDSNLVNRDGPQAHAEAVSLYPDNYALTTKLLEERKDDPNWIAVFLTTGESCPSCFTKQHVVVNEWIRSGLIERGRILNFYGADYDMTQDVAGFSDKDQLIDMQENPMGAPLTHGKVNFIGSDILDLNPEVQQVFRESEIPVAVITRDGVIIAKGYDTREQDNDPLATAEMNAVKSAFELQKAAEKAEPWNLSDAQMISATTLYEAPLARTAMFWASIPIGVHMRDATYGTPSYDPIRTIEAPGMTNAQLYAAATDRPYNGSNSLIHCFQASQTGEDAFQNLAQKAWRPRVARDAEKGKNIHYDGGSAGAHSPGCKC
ncbi:MAG: hypothetical protein AAF569_00035 [Pseudomonadota bacterium]